MFTYKLNFKLSEKQLMLSDRILELVKNGDNIGIDAVCGAGKTEILLETLKYLLNSGQKIGFAIPRKQLVIEIERRISEYFNTDYFGVICSIHRKNINSNLVFLTTHQLSKYHEVFDYLIIDEVDAFPFYNNSKLETDAINSSRNYIYLSATMPSKYYEYDIVMMNLYARHHGRAFILPVINRNVNIYNLLKELHVLKCPVIIFAPTKVIVQKIYRFLHLLRKKVSYCTSKTLNKEIINNVINKKFDIIVSTTILERGITIPEVNVIIYNADHNIFDYKTLLQIYGRIDRGVYGYDAKIVLMSKTITNHIKKSIAKVKEYNEM